VSVLHPDVCGGSFDNLLAVHSLSKRSNLAGYRAGFVVGDEAVVAELLAVRKHAGLMVPSPIQAAMAAAFGDDAHVEEQRERYIRRRTVLRDALTEAGWTITLSQGGRRTTPTAPWRRWLTEASWWLPARSTALLVSGTSG
jgi:aspartate/methionine/tyrosine aminotransferase